MANPWFFERLLNANIRIVNIFVSTLKFATAMRKYNSTNYLNQQAMSNCGIAYAVNLIGGRWKVTILWRIHYGINRFGELKRSIPLISEKVLSRQLRELEADELIHRKDHETVPSKVEYSLTEKMKDAIPAFEILCQWGAEVQQEPVARAVDTNQTT